ncbi:hypothetical protein KY49_6933 [Burkholderia sp. MSHR3999]|nr:hypothetical protein KY49_6933 [Burkholderia sp. MSHR3999]
MGGLDEPLPTRCGAFAECGFNRRGVAVEIVCGIGIRFPVMARNGRSRHAGTASAIRRDVALGAFKTAP